MKKMFLPILMFLAAILGIVPTTSSVGGSVDSNYSSEFGQKANAILDKKSFSGSVLVVKNGKIIFQASRGYSNYGISLSNTIDTSYEIDSIQKSMTAAMVMKEIQNKKLSLTDKLSKFYPEIPGSNNITIKEMMDMTSGLILKGGVGPTKVMSDTDIIDEDIKNIRYVNVLHGKWDYSAINFNLLSGILEKLTGKSYRKLFTESYIDKLNLKHTIFAYDESPKIQKATGYNNPDPLSPSLNYKNVFDADKFLEYDELGTGQVYMSVYDLYKVEQYITQGNMLSAKSRDQLYAPGSISTYGGGLYHTKDDNFANGWGYGFQGVSHISDDGKVTVIALENYTRRAVDLKPMANQLYKLAKD
ncbi:serine hydrolase domain-containing protein [Companilactobacillus alimentarius]|uniref:Penicillin-binding protein n=1 Tax=Companilactobacillus alimentarius DSM 20249 TaxID=1423720 RepID=A0A2K9HED6_9LACO|nr:serine hydrolase domain-containing protein [Companilactobacillus alimentarius]AUI70924.1 penicillin-binding protein [Companilactobacillus alimentarius DSM 20249]KRK75037.1 Beta-lactamase class C related penicillin binding protein [Companilactobacillus alimentarius DSM 20249]MDT6951881.1 serine hydrolase domain-containing protein [Companilactobacillus alimentarius]GEO44191.1 peptidase S12 [Companilactobacillus alimentarius]